MFTKQIEYGMSCVRKSTVFFVIAFSLSQTTTGSCHKEWVHQYIVKEAFKFLSLEFGMSNILFGNFFGIGGPNESSPGDNGYWIKEQGIGEGPWLTYDAVVVGAYQEDVDDIVWNIGESFGGWDGSSTHFWNSDSDDDDDDFSSIFLNILEPDVPNAYYKARTYFFGIEFDSRGFYIREGAKSMGVFCNTGYVMRGAIHNYQNLVDFHQTGSMRMVGYRDVLFEDDVREINPCDWQVNGDYRFMIAYNILGRIAHLLADMSVPAHTKDDNHPCKLSDGDLYELGMGSNLTGDCNEPHEDMEAENWNANTARAQGGLLWEVFSMNHQDALRYLFYSVSQLADFFPSKTESQIDPSGRIIEGNTTLSRGAIPFLTRRYAELGTPPEDLNHIDVANEVLNYVIRATATLFYWYHLKAGEMGCVPTLELMNTIMDGQPAIGDPGNTSSTTTFHVQAGESITAGTTANLTNWPSSTPGPVTILSTASVDFSAGQMVRLLDGFSALSGSNFHALIKSNPCAEMEATAQVQNNRPIAYGNGVTPLSGSGCKIIIVVNDSNDISYLGTDSIQIDSFYKFFGSPSTCDFSSEIASGTVARSVEFMADSVAIQDTAGATLVNILAPRQVYLSASSLSYIIHDTTSGQGNSEGEPPTVHLYPNPISSESQIEFTLPTKSDVIIEIYDILGNKVSELSNESQLAAGIYTKKLGAQIIPTGTYFVRFKAGKYVRTYPIQIKR